MIHEAARGCLNEQAALFTHKDMTGSKEKKDASEMVYTEGFDRALRRSRIRDKHLEEAYTYEDKQAVRLAMTGKEALSGKSAWRKIKLRISGLTDDSIVDGPGMRYTIFTQGCPHHCPGCHNPQTWSYKGGRMESLGTIMDEIRENPLLYGVTFSGGEPFDQAEEMAVLGRQVKDAGLNLMAYSGYTYEELRQRAIEEPAVGEMLDLIDILVDGRFELDKKDLTLLYRGSSNQRLIDLEKMRKNKDIDHIVLWDE